MKDFVDMMIALYMVLLLLVIGGIISAALVLPLVLFFIYDNPVWFLLYLVSPIILSVCYVVGKKIYEIDVFED